MRLICRDGVTVLRPVTRPNALMFGASTAARRAA
jgi:hypothetical protein